MEQKYKAVVSLIPIFYDKRFSQASPDHIKILIDNKQVINKEINLFHKDIKNCLEELFCEFIKISYEWPTKELISCRKINDTIEILYVTSMPFVNGSLQKGELTNVLDFINIIEDKFYVESINGNARRF